MKVAAFLISLLLLGLVSNGESRSLDTNLQCATNCEAQSNFLYQPGSTYNYQYSATVQSSFFAGPDVSPDQQSEVNIQANVALDILAPCEHVLRISRISLDQKNQDYLDTSEWQRSLTQNPMHFSFQDGRIADVCASNNDPEWVLNIKRGIVSAMQVSSQENNEAVVETDVTGTCASSYAVEYNGDIKTVRKSKDFNSCEEHEKMLLFSHFTPYSSESQRQRLMVQKQTCTQTISRGIVSQSICSEEHLFRPFSSEENGARTVLSQTLRFSHEERLRTAVEASQTRRTTLVFEKEPESESRQDITEITTLLNDLCEIMQYRESYNQVGKSFVNLVGMLRRLDGPAVEQAYSTLEGACVHSTDTLKSMFKDALKWCGSEGCVKFGTELIARGPEALDDETSLKWLLGMNMISEPTPAMIEGLLDVLQSGRFPEQTYLTTGTLIHGICSKNQNCLSLSPVRQALNFFEEKLGGNCYTPNEERHQEILLALRALGNAGRSNSVNILASCAKEQRNDAETRVAAMQAFRRMPCGTDRSLESIVFDTEEDSEIRIGAYTTTMKCPSTTFMSRLVMMMDTEPSQQVASYISTHLRNLIASSDPLKGYIKPYLVEAEFAKEYNLDPRKFSQYYEMSYFSEPLNAGVTAESSLIWSPKSFVPRSAGLNMTVDVFGQAVNIFEIGGRMEGVEGLLQDLMKEESFLQNTGIGKIFGKDELDVDSDDSEEVEEPTRRITREASEAHVNEKKEQYQNSINKDQFGASWYVRVFGNELKYGNSRFPDVYEKINEEISSIVMDIAQGKQVRYHDDMLLVNTANTIPTLVGLPLTLAINGSASVDVLGEGSMDLSSLLSTTPKLAMNAIFYPRATVSFSGAMSVDAHATRTGIQTESTALMSWKVSGQAALTNGKKFSIRVDTPTEGSTVFSFNHNLLKVVGEHTEPASTSYTQLPEHCSSVLGKEVCIQKSPLEDRTVFPPSGTLLYNVYFPFGNNVEYYQLDLSYDFVKDEQMVPSYIMGEITFDSSDPMQAHRHNLRFEMERDAGTVSSTVQYPTADGTTKIDLAAQYTKMQSQHSVRVIMNQDGTETQLMQTVFANDMHEIIPKMSLDSSWHIMGQERRISMAGAYMPSKLISFNTSLVNFIDRPIEFKVGLADESTEGRQRFLVRGNALVVIPDIYEDGLDFEMNIKARPDNYAAALTYTLKDQDEQSFRFVHKSVAKDNHQALTFKFVSTQFPNLNAVLATDNKQSEDTLETSAKLSYGESALERNTQNYISLSQMFSTAGTNEDRTDMRGDIEVLIPFMGFRKSLSWNLAIDEMEIDTAVRYNGEDFVQITMRDRTRSVGLMSKSFKFMIPTPWQNIVWEQTLQETRTNVYKANGEIRVGNNVGMDFQTAAVLENLDSSKRFTFEISGNNAQILSISSQHALLEPSGFTSTNTLESSYFGPARLNLRHEGATDGSFATEVLAEYSSQYHYKANLNFDNSVEKKCEVSAKVEFLDVYASVREFNLVYQHSTLPTVSTESLRYDGSVTITTNAIRGFSRAETSLLFSLKERNSFEISASSFLDNGSGFGFAVNYVASEDQTHAVKISYDQSVFALRSLPSTDSIEVTVNVAAEEKQVSVIYHEDKLRLDLTVADDVRGTFRNNMFTDYPQQFEVLLAGFAQGFTARMSAGRQVLNVRARAHDSRLLLEFENTFTQLSMVPQRVVYDLSWGTNSDKTGTWTTLQVNNQQATFEAFCTSARCEISFNPGTLTMDYLPRGASQYDLTGVSAAVDFDLSTNIYAIEFLYDDNKVITAEVNLNNPEISIQQKLTPALPRSIKLTEVSEANHHEISLTWDDSYTVLSLDYQLSPDIDVAAMYFSNCSVIAGSYKSKFVMDSNSAKLTFNVDRQLATATLEWSNNDDSVDMSFNFQQNIESHVMPRLMTAAVSLALRHHSLALQYNNYHIRHSYSQVSDLDSESTTFTVHCEQNVSDKLFNDVTVTLAVQATNQFVSNTKATFKLDDIPEFFQEFAFTWAEASDNLLKYKLETSQTIGNAFYTLSMLPSEMHLEFYQPRNPRTTEVGIKTGCTFTHASELDMEFEIKGERIGDDIILTHTHQNGMIARMMGNEMFDYSIETTITMYKGFSIASSLTVDPDTTFTATVGGNGEFDGSDFVMNTNIETNVFEILDLGVQLPKQLKTTTRVGVNLDDGSGGTSFDCEITRVYVEHGEDVTRVNHIEFSLGMELFNWNVQLSGKHDFEDFDLIPANFKYELVVSGSTPRSPVFFRSAALSVTTGANTQTSSFSLERNTVDNSIYASITHNVSMFLEYGVPGNMSIAFRPKSNYDFDISIVYDTSRKSVGFTFDYVADLNKVVLDVYHDFDMLTQQLNIPKEMGIEGQYQLNERDYYANVRTKFGKDIRNSEFILRWDGETLPELTSVTYRHSQNFTEQPYMPQKLRVKLTRSFDNAEFSARFTIDDDEIRFNLNVESADGEYSPSLYIAQNINKDYPRRMKVTGTLNTVEPRVEVKVKSGSSNLIDFSADYTVQSDERSIHVSLAQEISTEFSREVELTATTVVNTEQMNAAIDLSSDQLSFKVAFESGVDADAKSMYLQLTHDQPEWKNLGLALVTRFDGQLYVEDTYELTLRLLRDEIENSVSVSFNWNIARQSLMLSASMSHDITEIVTVIPNNVQGRFFGEYSTEGMLASFNATLNEDIYAHTVNIFLTPTTNGYTTGVTFMHDSSLLTEFEVPNSVGLKLAGEYNEGAFSGSFMFNYGQETLSAQLQAGPTPQMDVSFTVRSSALNYDGEVQFTASTDDLDMALTLNGERLSSVRGSFSVDEVELNLHQQFETTMLPSDITLVYSKKSNSEIDLSVEVVRQEKSSLSFSLKPTASGSIVSLQLNDGAVKELVSEYSLDQGSFSINLEQNIFESNVPRSAGFTTTFEGDTTRPTVFASLSLDDTTNTLSAQANLKEMSFSFEHDMPIPLLPRSMNAKVGYSLEEPLSFEASMNVDGVSARGSMNIYLGEEKGIDAQIQHNMPIWLTSPLSLSAKYSETRTYNFDLSTQVADFTGSVNVNVDLEQRSAQLTHTYAALIDYFIPRDIYVKADASAEQPITAELITRVDGVERSININLDLANNVYTFKQMIPELNDFPKTYVLSFSGSLQPFEARAQLVMDSNTRDVSVSSNGRLALSHSIPELDNVIPTSIDLTTDFYGSTGNAMLKYTLAGSDRHISFEYDFQPGKARVQFSENGIADMPTTVSADVSLDNKYRNVSANFVLNRNFFNIKSGLLLGDNDEGWYGAALSVNHNLNELSSILEPSTTSTLLLKARAFEVQAVVNNGRDVDYSATGQIQMDSSAGSRTVKVAYEHYLNGQSNFVHVNLGGAKIDSRYHGFFNASQGEPRRANNNIKLSLDLSFDDNFMIATTIGMAQNYQSLRNTLPRSIENGRFEIIVTPSEKRGQASMVATVDRDQIDFSTSVEVDEDRTDAQVSLNCRAANLRSTLHMQGRAGQYQLSAANRYRDSNSDRDDRVTVQVSISADNSIIEISAPIRELESMGIPTSYRVESVHQVTPEAGEYVIRASAGDHNIKLTARMSRSLPSQEFTLELNQNMFEPNDITFRHHVSSTRDHLMSASTTLTLGENMNTGTTLTTTRSGFRTEFTFTSFDSTFNSNIEYTGTGVVMRMDNNLLIEMPPSMYFSLNFAENVAMRFDYGSENIITLNVLPNNIEFAFDYYYSIRMNVPLRPAHVEAQVTINNSLDFDLMVDWTLGAPEMKATLTGDLDYGYTYTFSESLTFTSIVRDNIQFSLNVDTTILSFDVSATINTVDNDYNFSLGLLESEFIVNVAESKLMYSEYSAEKLRNVYGMELGDERNAVILHAGSVDQSYAITLSQPDEDTYKLNVAEKSGTLLVDIAHLTAVTTLTPKLDLKLELFFKDQVDIKFKVSHDPESNEARSMCKWFTRHNAIKTSLNFTLDSQNPAGEFSWWTARYEVMSTSFKFTQTQSGYDLDGKFKFQQRDFYQPIVFAISNNFAATATAVSTSGSLRILDFPVTSFDATLSQDVTGSSYNYTLIGNLNNGGLSQYVNFRTLSIAAWQQSENSGRRMFPSCSYTVAVDGEEYHLSFDSQIQSSAKTSRFDIDIHARHPHTVEIFGLPVPKRNDFGFNLLKRKRGVRVTVDYNSEFLASPVKLTKSWRSGKDGSIDGSLSIEYDASGDSILEVAYAFELLPENAGHIITFNVQHPSSSTSFETYLKEIQSASETGFEASLVNMKSTGSENWLLKMVYDHNDQVFKVIANQPGFVEPLSIRFDYHSLVNQVSEKVQEMIAQTAFDTSVVYGMESVEGGYDMFIGFEVAEGKSYTMHLKATAEETTATAEFYVRDTEAVVTGIADLKFSLVDGRFLKFQLSANPMLASAIEDVLLIVEAEFNSKTNMLVSNVIDLLNTLSSSVTGDKQVEDKIAEVIKAIVTRMTAAREQGASVVSDSIISVTGMLENGELVLAENTKAGIVHLMELIANANKILLQPFDDVVETFYGEFISEINNILSACLAPVKDALDVINAGDLFMEAVEDAVKQITEYLRVNGDELFFAIRGPMSNLVVVTEDEITITIPLSFELEDVNFTALPTTDAVESWFAKTSFSEHVRELVPQVYAYVDHFYRAKAFLNTPLSEQVPPFKGHAFVSDFKSFRTFDGHHFDFDSNCESSHILATDGSNGNFTIIMNYGPTPSFDIRVGSEDVIITADEHVAFNQNNAILPIITASGLTVNRIGDIIKLVYNDDITIDFDTKTNLFTVEINPFYFAATGGLLGVYDNEPNFDYVTPTGERVDDVVAFVKSWEVSSTLCARKNQIVHITSAPSKCAALFSSNNSPFRACFPVVSQQAFADMCSLDQADFCKIAKSYQYTCQLSGVSVGMPEDCNQCHDESGQTFGVGETRSVETGSVDIVLVIQENGCLRSRSKPLGKFLRKFLKQTTNSFRTIQLPDTQFHVVGYGGPGANGAPHSFTMRGKISSNKKSDVSKVIRKIDLSPEGTPSDAVSAIDFATKLSFRSGAQQVIVHISCDECSENAMAAQVQRNLQERNIAFHHMPIRSIDTDSDKHVYGYSENQAFVKKAKNFDRSLINESTTDHCLPIALSSRGSVWNGIDMKSSDLVSHFTDYLTANVTPGGTRTCTCEVNEMGAPATRCVSA